MRQISTTGRIGVDHESPTLRATISLARIATCSLRHSRSARTKAKRPRPRSLAYSRMAKHLDRQLTCSNCSIRGQRKYCLLGRRRNLQGKGTIACCMEESRDKSKRGTQRRSMRHSLNQLSRNREQTFLQRRTAQNAFNRRILCKHFFVRGYSFSTCPELSLSFPAAASKTINCLASKV